MCVWVDSVRPLHLIWISKDSKAAETSCWRKESIVKWRQHKRRLRLPALILLNRDLGMADCGVGGPGTEKTENRSPYSLLIWSSQEIRAFNETIEACCFSFSLPYSAHRRCFSCCLNSQDRFLTGSGLVSVQHYHTFPCGEMQPPATNSSSVPRPVDSSLARFPYCLPSGEWIRHFWWTRGSPSSNLSSMQAKPVY